MSKAKTGLAVFVLLLALRSIFKRRARAQRLAANAHKHSVAIIGAGFGGIATAKKCIDLGIPFHIYEMAEDFGGTWLKNSYPGCGCDVPSHAYSFSWALNPQWSRKWVKRDEILAYIFNVAKTQLGLHQHASFHTKLNSARYRDGEWTLEVENVQTGELSTHKHTFLMSAVGQLNVPYVPAQFDAAKFKGQAIFHSARWPEQIDLKDKRVAVIGTGATSIQLVPELSKLCKQVDVFQRSPLYVVEKADYEYPWWAKQLFQHVPLVMRLYRMYIFAAFELIFAAVIPNVRGSVTNRMFIKFSSTFMASQMDSDLKEKMLPPTTELIGCKRILTSNEWCALFNRGKNCTLHTEAASEITPTGVRTVSGKQVDADIVVFGTGFLTGSFLHGMQIDAWDEQEKRFVDLHRDVWQHGQVCEAYRGVTVKQMPNFAMCYAANTNLNHSSIISIIEAEVEHFFSLVKHVVASSDEGDLKQFCVKPRAYETFNVQEQALLKDTVFSSDCESWYKRNPQGRILNNFHGSLIAFWRSTAKPRWEDYTFT